MADPICMLLSNLTKVDSISILLIQIKTTAQGNSTVEQLVEIFTSGEGKHFNSNANYNFLASVLANLSTASFLFGHLM